VHLRRIVNVDAAGLVQTREGTPRQPAGLARGAELTFELRLFPILEQNEWPPARPFERAQRRIEIHRHTIEPQREPSGVMANAAGVLQGNEDGVLRR
jgi:hypothetical protein